MLIRFKEWIKKVKPRKNSKEIQKENANLPEYFKLAPSWADDMTCELIDSRERYRVGFYTLLILGLLLTVTIVVLASTQHFQYVMLEHWPDGSVTEHTVIPSNTLFDSNLIKSELVKYVVNRESYHPATYATQYSLVESMSNSTVTETYQSEQNSQNKSSPIVLLGKQGYRKVTIQPPIIFYDRKTHQNDDQHKNIAVVNFTVTEHNTETAEDRTTPYTATIEWTHLGTPNNPTDALNNWDGFQVTQYEVEPRNMSNESKGEAL